MGIEPTFWKTRDPRPTRGFAIPNKYKKAMRVPCFPIWISPSTPPIIQAMPCFLNCRRPRITPGSWRALSPSSAINRYPPYEVALPAGLEPATPALGKLCSIHLSYGSITPYAEVGLHSLQTYPPNLGFLTFAKYFSQ